MSTPCTTAVRSPLLAGQAFGSIPSRWSSLRPKVFIQLAKLIPASRAAASNCSFNSGAILTWKAGAFPLPLGCLSRCITVDMYVPIKLRFKSIGTHLNMLRSEKTTPRSARNTYGASNQQRYGD
ncbi:predicted protein [Escherichia coli O127:H6 str. E2348/69]|uniref:Uncharacterized protein n=1 Tax=Escherichia coli O127:H6 (strain E2348/69 / EPEC) TaxID=574521 RepID=B7UM60_ECO27|nr:predicted protein [Escherichia coli O127:H6 str. E2348/69]